MLKIEDLHIYYGGVHALKGINVEVPAGKVITLIGANGAGKSSTLRCVCGLVKLSSGRVLFEGNDISTIKSYERVRMGIAMVPEGRRIFTNMSVMENLQMGAFSRKDTAGIKNDLERVYTLFPKMKERTHQKAVTLSGGEQQMLAVSRALMSNPRLLLMDEPSLGLAPTLIEEMYRTIEVIHSAGLTIMLVEQNARSALKLANYGYVMEVGNIVLQGPSIDLANDEGVKRAYIGA